MDLEIKLYTAKEVAKILHISTDAVYDRVKDGSFRCYRFGRKLMFSMEQMKAFVESNEINKD